MPHDVTQADREAAAKLLGYRDYDDATDYRLSGAQDRAVANAVQAFAAHRLAAIAEERARVVAFLRAKGWTAVNKTFEPGADWIAAVIERGDHIQEK